MQVVDVDYILATFSVDIVSQLININTLWCTLHHDNDDVLDDREGGEKDDDREEVGAERICIP